MNPDLPPDLLLRAWFAVLKIPSYLYMQIRIMSKIWISILIKNNLSLLHGFTFILSGFLSFFLKTIILQNGGVAPARQQPSEPKSQEKPEPKWTEIQEPK